MLLVTPCHTLAHVCAQCEHTHIDTHMPTTSLFPQVPLTRSAKGQDVPVQVPAWPLSAVAVWAGPLPTLRGFLLTPH